MLPTARAAHTAGMRFLSSHARRSPPRPALLRWLVAPALLARTWALAAEAPGTPAAALPTRLSYHSALAGYQAYAEQPVQSWRQANDRVGQIGGWRSYAREAAAPAEPTSPAAAPPAPAPGAPSRPPRP